MLTITKKLDMSPHGVPQVIRVSQYDSDFTLEFKLFASGGNFALSTGTTAEIRGTKQSGTGYSASATLDTSTKVVTVAGAAQMTAVAGMNIFEIVLKKNNKEISSANFCLMVERAALDADTITDESVLKELNAIIEGAETATQAAEEAEDAADRAEAAAQTLVIDPTLTLPGQPADAKAVGDKLAPLIGGDEQREITGWVYSKYINVANANIGDTVDITNVSSFYSLKYVVVDCEEGDKFLLNLAGAASARAWTFLTSDNVLISKADASVTLSNEEVIAPENAGKAIFQCIYRQSDTDTTTDNGKAYKIVQGSGDFVRFGVVQNKTEEEKARARDNIGLTDCYKIKDIQPVHSTAQGWRIIQSTGLAESNSDYKIVKYAINEGETVEVTLDGCFQFQAEIGARTEAPSNRIGNTYGSGTFTLEVPQGAKYLLVSIPATGISSVYVLKMYYRLTNAFKAALLNCFSHVAWDDRYGQDYYDELEQALNPEKVTPEVEQQIIFLPRTNITNDARNTPEVNILSNISSRQSFGAISDVLPKFVIGGGSTFSEYSAIAVPTGKTRVVVTCQKASRCNLSKYSLSETFAGEPYYHLESISGWQSAATSFTFNLDGVSYFSIVFDSSDSDTSHYAISFQ